MKPARGGHSLPEVELSLSGWMVMIRPPVPDTRVCPMPRAWPRPWVTLGPQHSHHRKLLPLCCFIALLFPSTPWSPAYPLSWCFAAGVIIHSKMLRCGSHLVKRPRALAMQIRGMGEYARCYLDRWLRIGFAGRSSTSTSTNARPLHPCSREGGALRRGWPRADASGRGQARGCRSGGPHGVSRGWASE